MTKLEKWGREPWLVVTIITLTALSIVVWTNTLPFDEPSTKFTLPHFLQGGDVRQLGICYPEFNIPFFILITLVSVPLASP